ncbi:MAG: methyltransferase domain-containing protein [Gammaproteobacteria bacterium]|nr:methyltransferase domain-containing protein [Gammaproteobacteria bacterium]
MNQQLMQSLLQKVQGSLMLNVAYIGVTNYLFEKLSSMGRAGVEDLAEAATIDVGYTRRWCDAAYGFELLEEDDQGRFSLTELGRAFVPDTVGSLMPFAIQSILSAHMADRAAELMRSGERPGEKVLAERSMILPWFGPMLEALFGPFLEQQILPKVPVYAEINRRQGLAVDLGCGNGWYLRRMAKRYPHLRGIGLDGFEENINQASSAAVADGVAERVSFRTGDIHQFTVDEPVDLIAMNRALHHVWDDKDNVFRILSENLRPGGSAVIWEPNWPSDRRLLRDPGYRAMAFQNLSEHIQGNHFLTSNEISEAFREVDMEPEVYLFGEGKEVVVVGRKH